MFKFFHQDSGEFTIVNATEWNNNRTVGCATDNPLEDVTIELTLRRRATHYTHLFVVPAAVTSLLMPFIFVLPADSREKLILGDTKNQDVFKRIT